jgi:hypothetical protein
MPVRILMWSGFFNESSESSGAGSGCQAREKEGLAGDGKAHLKKDLDKKHHRLDKYRRSRN